MMLYIIVEYTNRADSLYDESNIFNKFSTQLLIYTKGCIKIKNTLINNFVSILHKYIKFGICSRRMPLRRKIIFLAALMVLLPMGFAGLYFNNSISSILTQNAIDRLSQSIHQTSDNIESTFEILSNTPMHFLSRKSIRDWLAGEMSIKEDYNLFAQITQMEDELKYSLMFNSAWDMQLINTAYVFFNETSYFSTSRTHQNIEEMNENNIHIYKLLSDEKIRGSKIIPPSQKDKTIYFTRTVSNINKPDESIFLIYGANESKIYDKYAPLLESPESIAYIVDEKGTLYSCPNKNELGSKIDNSILCHKNEKYVYGDILNGQQYFLASKAIGETGLSFIIGIPKSHILSKLSYSTRNYILIIIIIVLVSIIFSIFLSLILTRFIKELLHNINKVKAGNYDSKMPVYKNPELNVLSDTFNNMTQEIKYLIKQVYEKQLLLKETEYKFLQSQINPHFLFNTLITISYKARLSGDETVYSMVTSLSELLQAGIYSSSSDKITILRELQYVKFYLYLQKVRFEDKLEYNIHLCDDSILECFIPKLCIEPIVENAIVHGLETKMSKCTVDIFIKQENSSIYFEIIDDGVGFDADSINLDDSINTEQCKKSHTSIGLKNTHKRIQLMYGNQYGILIKSVISKGSTVIVHIPVDKGGLQNV